MRVLVCGSREWTDIEMVHTVLDGLVGRCIDAREPMTVIGGGARGADAAAHCWHGPCEVGLLTFPADWDRHGKAAGHIRNQRMLDEGKPDVVLAFKDGFLADWTEDDGSVHERRGGTEDMVRRVKAAGIPVYVVSHG
jgi:hypothetical protein